MKGLTERQAYMLRHGEGLASTAQSLVARKLLTPAGRPTPAGRKALAEYEAALAAIDQ